MRLLQFAMIALLAGSAVAGCLPARPAADTALGTHPFANANAADLVRVDIAIIERPAGDPYLCHTLWDLADEQVVDFERKPILDDNGIRVGVIGGLLPADLLKLLNSNKSCADPHRVQLRAGGSTPIALGSERAKCRFSINQGERLLPVQLEHATCTLEVVPAPGEDGRMTLHFTPIVKHGAVKREPRAVRDPSGEHRWDMEMRQATENYDALSWEVSIGADEYLVIGTRLDRDDTLGQQFFLDAEANPPTQRLVVIRSGRVFPDVSPSETGTDGAAPPLALQAGWRSARGSSPLYEIGGTNP